MVFNSKRDVIDIALQYTAFFAEESCGYCTPCRVGNELMLKYLKAVQEGKAEAGDLELMKNLGETMTVASRCGLGQTAANPALTSMASFPEAYQAKVIPDPADGSNPDVRPGRRPEDRRRHRRTEEQFRTLNGQC